MNADTGWHFFIDRGGTFTDIVAIDPAGRLQTLKLLSENPAHYADAALAGIAQLTAGSAAPIASVRLGTTIGTNALLERRGARTVLVITAGFADLLRIGSQQRPDIFALDIRLPAMLYDRVIEADERIGADGEILRPLDQGRLARELALARDAGAESVAIALLHAWREPRHEELAADLAREAGFACISVGSRIDPSIRLVDRGDTAVVDAYLSPVLDRYKESLSGGLASRLAEPRRGGRLLFMQSHGGLAEADAFRGCDSVLSGPAGGVVGMAATAADAGYREVIGFDMGGTSTDVSVYAGEYERSRGERIAGCRIARPMLRINTVAAGGGSLLSYRGGRLQVGPESAGAWPGPACYRNGGPLTLTDANVLLGRIQADCFPRVFGPNADAAIDPAPVTAGFDELAAGIRAADGGELTPAELAEGFIRIAVTAMAAAIEQISVQRGHDVTRFALSCFGGAGGQHACAVADALGVETILIGPLSGVLSAYGIGVAERRTIAAAGLHAVLDAASLAAAGAAAAGLADELHASIAAITRIEYRIAVRSAGSDTLISLPYAPDLTAATIAEAFAAAHRRRFGFAPPGSELVLQSIEAEAIAAEPLPARRGIQVARPAAPTDAADRAEPADPADRAKPAEPAKPVEPAKPAKPAEAADWREIRFAGAWQRTPVWRRDALVPGRPVDGPAMIAEDHATIVVEPGWTAAIGTDGMLILKRTQPASRRERTATTADPIMLEIFNNQFMHIAEQMGLVLEQTAHSVNIKERLDYSCALFDSAGELIANAPHVPVHLGSMGDSVRAVIRTADGLQAGDAWMLNAPYRGGTHLPDITVVMPVFEAGADQPGFFVASRAHHADIGGTTPGSMPALSHRIDEEGIVIEPLRILRDGVLLEPVIVELLTSGPYPARNPSQNLADLKAQLAANASGTAGLARLLERYGSEVVHAYMGHVRSNAADCTRDALRALADGRHLARLDSGEVIAVAVSIDREAGRARIDFSGSAGISASNLNAPQAVVRAVVLYVLRTLIRENIPLNAGCLEPIDLVIPAASLLDPIYPAAVAGGNVETSQCLADALLAAFGAAAASQGTMNNLTFGNARHQYYETICGGCGAGPGFDGASAVHSHMTNSRLTDVEVLEQRFPVRVRRFSIRRGSGGSGRWQGGDGVIREIEFLEPMQASLLASRRRVAPPGLAGGGDGQPGRDRLIRADGRIETLANAAEFTLAAGDRLLIETPGGGAWGSPVSGRQ